MKKRKKSSWVTILVILLISFFTYNGLRMWYVAAVIDTHRSMQIEALEIMRSQGNNKTKYFSNTIFLTSLKLPSGSKIFDVGNGRKTIIYKEFLPPKIKFIFTPITPAGRSLKANLNENKKERECFWIFSEPNWFYPYFSLITDNFNREILDENKISWYYQCLLKDLTSEELEKEKKYRKKKGLPKLK